MGKIFMGEEASRLINISYNLRYMLRDNGISVAALAKQIELKEYRLRSYVNAKAMPSDEELEMIANELKCDVNELTKKYNYDLDELNN